MNTSKLASLITLTALCIAIQFAPRPPNVEFTSFITFIIGLTQGTILGALFGAFVMFVNGFLSPWGFSGLNMPFQMVGMAIVGFSGGIYRKFTHNELKPTQFCLETAILGGFIALIYDIITNIGVGIQFILSGTPPMLAIFSALAYGAFFSAVHVSSNSIVFGVLFVPFMKILNGLKIGETSWLKREPLYS